MKQLKLLILYTFLAISFVVEASIEYGKTCLTNGDCQKELNTELGTKTIIERIGTDFNGAPTCRYRQYQVNVGQLCEKKRGRTIGVCRRESLRPYYDLTKPPNCENAISRLKL